METNYEQVEKFINYHKGKVSHKEKKQIEQSIKDDDTLKEQFDELRILEENIRLYYWQKDAQKALKQPNKGIFSITWRKVAIAASVIIISSLGYLSISHDYLPDVVIEEGVLRGKEATEELGISPQEKSYNLFVMGKASYHATDFKNAISYYIKALETPNLRNQIQEAIKWHLCIAYLRNNQPKEAEEILNNLEMIDNPKYEINAINKAKVKVQIFLKKTF